MRILATALCAALAAGAFLTAGIPLCRAGETKAAVVLRDAPGARDDVAAQPGTEEEERAYAQREADSPEVQRFEGGFLIELLLVAVLVLVIILLARQI